MNRQTVAFKFWHAALLLLLPPIVVTLSGCPLQPSDCPSYSVEIDASNFVAQVTNPFYPLTPGTSFTFEKNTNEGLERVVTAIETETKSILGVSCVVVHDRAMLDDVLIEDTYDWYAQDTQGNVWYFGEDSSSFENGFFVDKHGSWEAGVDGAQPGIIMHATPRVGTTYYQEFLCGVAEDQATVLALDESVQVPHGDFSGCVKTHDFSRLDPTLLESKYYASGVGFVLAVEADGMLELVDITTSK